MAPAASVSMTGNKRIVKWLDRWIEDTGKSPRPMLLLVAGKMREVSIMAFSRQRDPKTRRPWKRTSALTLGARAGRRGGDKTLANTGLLLQSLTGIGPVGGRGRKDGPKILAGATGVRQSTNRPGARVHQTGKPAVIRPIHAQHLWIPKTCKASRAVCRGSASGGTGSGVRRAIAALESQGENPRDHFILAKKVRTVKRPFLGFHNQDTRDTAEILANFYHSTRTTGKAPKTPQEARKVQRDR